MLVASRPGLLPRHRYLVGIYLCAAIIAAFTISNTWTYTAMAAEKAASPRDKCKTNVWKNLEKCGWPGPKNTGYPAGKKLKNTPSRTITQDGTVIKGEKIGDDGLTIGAKDVVVKKSWIIKRSGGEGQGVVKVLPGASVKIIRSRLDGSGATKAGIMYDGVKLVARRNHISGVNDGFFVSRDNFILKSNYLHDFTTNAGNGHVDGFQTEGASHGIIQHNVFDIEETQTSAVAIWNMFGNSDDILVKKNLIAGGGFAIYAQDYHPSSSNPNGGYSVTNIRFRKNRFSTVHYGCVGYWGVWFPRGEPTDKWRRSGNKVLETGYNVDNGNPPKPGGGFCN